MCVINNTRGCSSIERYLSLSLVRSLSLRHPHTGREGETDRPERPTGREHFYFVFDKVRAAVCLFMVM